ncbi:hypothetical protein DPMN_039005 [Dreissena polymorpha]|uniref:PARP catalytic domain-containing protein n=1 Tax=Dreissena polymorpha TaxID=45954 RepID=A0A9D4RP73_DREPO|nr:hypothetical protein DPMN_039005 [Dreissena polymorpha]
MEPDEFVQNIRLYESEDEFMTVSLRFLQTHPNREIIMIQRIQSEFLWEHFCVKRKEMEKMNSLDGVNEMNLFH